MSDIGGGHHQKNMTRKLILEYLPIHVKSCYVNGIFCRQINFLKFPQRK